MAQALQVARPEANKSVAELRNAGTALEIVCDKSQRAKWFPGLAKLLSKDKPAAAIHHLTGERERTCYDWCAGAVDPPARAVIKLLHSAVGWSVLEFLMRGCKQPWWHEVVRARACAAAFDQASGQMELGL